MAKVTKDSIIEEVICMDIGTVEVFLESGMHCIGCPAARAESIEEACMVHGIDPDELVENLNDYLESGKKDSEGEAE